MESNYQPNLSTNQGIELRFENDTHLWPITTFLLLSCSLQLYEVSEINRVLRLSLCSVINLPSGSFTP